MKKIINCDLCGSKDLKPLCYNQDRIYGFKEIFEIIKCESCGLVFFKTPLDKKELSKYYPQKKILFFK